MNFFIMQTGRSRRWLRAAGLIAMTLVLICGLAAQQGRARGRVVSERTDPATGARWVLMQDAEPSAAPGRWVLAEAGDEKAAGASREATRQKLVIHAGDRIVVEERTAVMRARVEGTALESAGDGGALQTAEDAGELRARLTIGGQLLAVRAIAPGRAEIRKAKTQEAGTEEEET